MLIVDDSIDDIYILTRQLHRAGNRFPVQVARDGDDAISLLSKARPGTEFPLPLAIFIDLKMPDCDGFALLRWIRSSPRLHQVLTVVTSASDLRADVARAYQLGCHAYLRKPLSAEDCTAIVAAAEAFAEGSPVPDLPGYPDCYDFTT